jgi:hypothetical protein
MTRLARDYTDAYATAYRWFRNTVPGGWLLSAGLIPGSPLRITLAAVKHRASPTT